MWWCLWAKQAQRKWGSVWAGDFSLSLSRCSHFLARLWAKFKRLFYPFYRSFISFYFRFCSFYRSFISSCRKFFYFIAVLSRLFIAFSHLFVVAFRFIIVLTHLFTCKRHFLGHCAFLKFLNALFVRFCALFVILSLCKKATQRVARRKPQQKNPHKLKENLPFLDTSLTLSMTNSGFCLKMTDIFTQILKQKFKFFTQNSKHFTNPTHFINFTQNLSPTQGFFIFLPQVFAQCKLIKNFLQGGHYV